MSVESLIFDTLKGFVANRVYPDIAPEGVVALPRITYQQVSGLAVNYVSNSPPGVENARQQISVWGGTRLQVNSLARQVKNAIRAQPLLHATVLGELVATYEPDTKLYGTRQDFSLWTQV